MEDLSLLLWKDIVGQVVKVVAGDDEQMVSTKNELSRRCLLA